MANITIRNLDDQVKARLRVRAAQYGRSMEEEARQILRSVLSEEVPPQRNLAESIRRKVEAVGGFDLPTVPREPMREPPTIDS